MKIIGNNWKRLRDRVRACANGWYTVDRTPETFAEAARRVVTGLHRHEVRSLRIGLDGPERHGLGIDIDWDGVKSRSSQRPHSLGLFAEGWERRGADQQLRERPTNRTTVPNN